MSEKNRDTNRDTIGEPRDITLAELMTDDARLEELAAQTEALELYEVEAAKLEKAAASLANAKERHKKAKDRAEEAKGVWAEAARASSGDSRPYVTYAQGVAVQGGAGVEFYEVLEDGTLAESPLTTVTEDGVVEVYRRALTAEEMQLSMALADTDAGDLSAAIVKYMGEYEPPHEVKHIAEHCNADANAVAMEMAKLVQGGAVVLTTKSKGRGKNKKPATYSLVE